MSLHDRRSFLLAGAAAGLSTALSSGPALAQSAAPAAAAPVADLPARPMKLIVASPAGGLMDNYARMFAEHLTARSGQPAIVENRPGASATATRS